MARYVIANIATYERQQGVAYLRRSLVGDGLQADIYPTRKAAQEAITRWEQQPYHCHYGEFDRPKRRVLNIDANDAPEWAVDLFTAP